MVKLPRSLNALGPEPTDPYTDTSNPMLNSGPGEPNSGALQFNQQQMEGAVGPSGYNRQWLPYINAISRSKVGRHFLTDPTSGDMGNDPGQTGPFGTFGGGTGGNMPDGTGNDDGTARLNNALAGLTTKKVMR